MGEREKEIMELMIFYFFTLLLEATSSKCQQFFFVSLYNRRGETHRGKLSYAFFFTVCFNKRSAAMMKQAGGRQTKDVGYREQYLLNDSRVCSLFSFF